MRFADVIIAGAGVVGSALALELRRRGCDILLIDRASRGAASWAAAGMLAAHDPHNPPALRGISDLALALYPEFLQRICGLSGMPVPVQTRTVLEPGPGPALHEMLAEASVSAGTFHAREESSLDPRQLLPAIQAAVNVAGAQRVSTDHPFSLTRNSAADIEVCVADDIHRTKQFVDCTGAWSTGATPAKGQMSRVQLAPGTLALRHDGGNAVVRTKDIYLVPRMDGSALIGATVEDVGFDLTVEDPALHALRAQAARLVPAVAAATTLEGWAGLRPRTKDDLPIIGELQPGCFIAGGMFRNGILLAPAVAHVMAQMLCGEEAQVSLEQFRPDRFG